MLVQRQKRIDDVLLLTGEVSNPLIREEAITNAGRALKNMGNQALALKEYRQCLKLNPANIEFRHEEAFHLGRLNQSSTNQIIMDLTKRKQRRKNPVVLSS